MSIEKSVPKYSQHLGNETIVNLMTRNPTDLKFQIYENVDCYFLFYTVTRLKQCEAHSYENNHTI